MKKIILTEGQLEMIKSYVKLIAKNKHPKVHELKEVGITKGSLNHHFGSLSKLRLAAKQQYPDTFKNIVDAEIYNPQVFKKIQEIAKGYNKFVITTAVTGCEVHSGFMKSIKRYCAKNKAMLLILPSTDPAAKAGWTLDSSLSKEHVIFSDMSLNSNLWISSIKLSAKQVDPITGLARMGHRNGSFIYASPKQRMKPIPRKKGNLPRVLMTTGAITKANYSTERYMSERTATISTHDHVLGAIVVEIQDSKIYHFRQIQAEKSGAFVDLGNYYKPEGIGWLQPEAFVLGDYHAGETDSSAERCWLDVISQLKPKKIIFHDLFNGLSINHHEKNQHLLKAMRSENKQLNLMDEIRE